MSQGNSMLEVFQLNKHSKEEDLEQCLIWLREVFHDKQLKTISIVVKRSGGYDPLNQTSLSKVGFRSVQTLNTSANASLMNNNSALPLNSFNIQPSESQFTKRISEKEQQSNLKQTQIKAQERGVQNDQREGQRESINQQSQHQNDNNTSLISDSSFNSNSSRIVDENDAFGVSEKARQLYQNQNFKEALEAYNKSQSLTNTEKEISHQKLYFQNQIYIGSIYAQMKQRQQAIQELSQALEIRSRFNINENSQLNESQNAKDKQQQINSNPIFFIHLTLGNLYNEEKQLDEAIHNLQRAYEEIENATSLPERKSQALVLNTLGMIFYSKNQIPTSIQKFQQSLSIFQDILQLPECANDNVLLFSYANRLNNLGEAFRRNKQIDESIEKFKESLKLKQEIQASNKDTSIETEKSIASTYNNLGMSYFSIKKIDDAISNLNIAIQKHEKIIQNGIAQDKVAFANILNQRGDCFRANHDFIASCQDFQRSYEAKQEILGQENKSTIMTLNNYSQMLFATKQLEKSQEAFFNLLNTQKKVFGEKDIQVAQTLNNISTVLTESKEYEQAEEYIQEAISIYSNLPGNEQNLERVKRNLLSIQSKKASQIKQQQQ